MASTADFRNGMVVELDGDLFSITYFQHVKPGKGGAFVRTKLKNVLSGAVIEKTFRAGEKVEEVRLVRRPVQYSYSDGQFYYFMDEQTYEQIPLPAATIGEDQLVYLKENMVCSISFFEGRVIGVQVPFTVELQVKDTEPGLKGATVTNVYKPATLETGAVVSVPPFIEKGEIIRVDTRDGKYLERVKQ